MNSLKRLAFGQLLSCLQAASGVINALLQERRGVNVPILQAALTYSLLAVLFWKHHRIPKETTTLWFPLLGAIVFDVVASWMIVAAFAKLQLGQVILLLGLSTPSSMLFNHFWNPRSYAWPQLAGIGLALGSIAVYWGGIGNVLEATSVLYLVLGAGAAVSYAASNNFQEFICTRLSSGQFLFWLGAVGALMSWSALLCFTSHELTVVVDWLVIVLIGAYVLVLASFYALIPVYLRGWGSAVSFNLSLLSANLIGAVGECWLVREGGRVSWELMAAIGGLSAGLIIFYVNEPRSLDAEAEENRISDSGTDGK